METMEGVASYPMISLLIFFVFFVLLFLWVITASREHIREMEHMPLEENDQPQNTVL